jgi:ssDNA-binding replication factor A large subunit
MYKIPLADIKIKIVESGKLSGEDLDNRIKSKINDLSGLISEEGAAHIIANELGINLVEQNKDKLKIKELYAGMKNIHTAGKVVRKFDVNEFQKGSGTGKVCSLVLGDETGTIRVVFWNDQVEQLNGVNVDDILLVNEAYIKENRGGKEIHLGDRGEIEVNPEGLKIDGVRQTSQSERKKINELGEGLEGVEILGTVVQAFDPRFFNVCSKCSKRVTELEGNFQCAEHGQVERVVSYVMNLVLDDGTGTIRGVFWKNQTNHLLEMSEEQVAKYNGNLVEFEDVKTDLLGEQFKITGRIKKNDMFDRLELNAQLVEKADPEEEIKKLESTQ